MSRIARKQLKLVGHFLSTGATITWSAEAPGFRFESDMPPDPKASLISVLGREKNGVFFGA